MGEDILGFKPLRHFPYGREVADSSKTIVRYEGEQAEIVDQYGAKAFRNGYETIEVNGKTYSRPLEDEEAQEYFDAFMSEWGKEPTDAVTEDEDTETEEV